MTRRMSSTIFNQLARNVKVGVFTKSEGLTVFPEYASLRDRPGCYNGNCDGSCAQTCTFDHRKYSSIAGTGGQLTAIVQDNILCNGQDPYHGQSNQLVHEFAHTVMRHGVSSATRNQIKAAYNHAVSARLWTPGVYAMQNEEEYWAEGTQVFFNVEHLSYTTGGMNTLKCDIKFSSPRVQFAAYNHAVSARLWTPGVYAMQNEEEYWAEGTQVFFNVEHLSYTTGGMNTCNSGSYCSSEQASRHWLGTHDLTLYNILQLVWENNQGFQPSGIKVCQR
ncbi:hypothetical protein FSP39_022459 [Pinctada imbricata]|uniref:Uncharacterized protein n=1 Tax=Pinctada imbricata TaxID=66713 RepID=A0AA88XK08_PINIB|nr:hypothetical protein FSP39_022459 [Pinctada imbricata]